jgi:phosphoribosylformylglycinamidine cyclo-ligase
MLGSVDAGAVLDGSRVRVGDRLLGVGSDGLHTNGYSLARRILGRSKLALDAALPGGEGESVGSALLAPHRWYGRSVLPVLETGHVHAIAHITGGGIAGNLVRVLAGNVDANVHASAWPRPPVFRWLCEAGHVPEPDARQAFNLGIGLVLVCSDEGADAVRMELESAGERVHVMGEIVAGSCRVKWMD